MYKIGEKIGMLIALLLSTIVSLALIYWIMILFKTLGGVLS